MGSGLVRHRREDRLSLVLLIAKFGGDEWGKVSYHPLYPVHSGSEARDFSACADLPSMISQEMPQDRRGEQPHLGRLTPDDRPS